MGAPSSAAATPAVSVVIPVYKTEKYLAECIESVLAQTFENFEMILIDDGSPDNCGKICDDYAARDPRIRVFHKPNGGVSSARNLGLGNARGEWIAFVDSDDWLAHAYLERLLAEARDGVCISAVGVTQVSEITRERRISRFRRERIDEKDICGVFGRESMVPFWGPFAKLFRNPLIFGKSVRFRESVYYAEDWIFLLEYLRHIRGGIRFIDDFDLYFYRRYENSSSARFFGFERELEWYRLGRDILKKFIGAQNGWAWSWQTSILLTRVFRCMNLQSSAQRIVLEHELSDFQKFFRPETVVQKIAKSLFVGRYYRILRFFESALPKTRRLRRFLKKKARERK